MAGLQQPIEIPFQQANEMNQRGEILYYEIAPNQQGLVSGTVRVVLTDRNGQQYYVIIMQNGHIPAPSYVGTPSYSQDLTYPVRFI